MLLCVGFQQFFGSSEVVALCGRASKYNGPLRSRTKRWFGCGWFVRTVVVGLGEKKLHVEEVCSIFETTRSCWRKFGSIETKFFLCPSHMGSQTHFSTISVRSNVNAVELCVDRFSAFFFDFSTYRELDRFTLPHEGVAPAYLLVV